MRRSRALIGAVLVAGSLTAVAAASFPGTNGLIVRVSGKNRNHYTLVVSRPEGSHERQLLPASWLANPQWSPDGTQIAVDRDSHVTVIDADGRDALDLGEGANPAWSPDGSEIVFNMLTADAIGILAADGSGTARYLIVDEGAGDDSKWDPSWSPDGTRIAFTRGSGESSGQIWLIRADGTGARAVTRSKGYIDSVPSWSPDGRWIAFQRYVACGDGTCRDAVYVIHPNGTGVRRVILDGAAPAWSPDGTRIVFTRRLHGSSEVFTVRLNGRDLRQVTHNGVSDLEPDWQPL